MAIRLAIIDRVGFHIEMLSERLRIQPDFQIVAAATIYDDFVEAARQADVAIILQEQEVDLTRYLIQTVHEELPDIRVIVVSVPDDPSIILNYIEAGASGYVREVDSSEQLLNVIRVVGAGEALAHPGLIAPLFERLATLGAVAQDLIPPALERVDLTPRQAEIAELIAQDLSNEQIARRLDIAEGTVKNHVHAILQAFNADSRHQVAVIYRHLHRAPPADVNSGQDVAGG